MVCRIGFGALTVTSFEVSFQVVLIQLIVRRTRQFHSMKTQFIKSQSLAASNTKTEKLSPTPVKILVSFNVICVYLRYSLLVGLPSLACVHPPACYFINIRGLLVKIPTKITVIVSHSQSWLNVNFYIARLFN
jgi:hypothetical protein